MNTKQYEDYFSRAWNDITNALDGYKYRDIQAVGDSAATIAANYMQQEENEKAYQRSKPTTQVSNMMAAGMSRAGALNAINGGGSYTPTPIQAASPGTAASNVKQQDLATAESVLSGVSSLASNVQQFMQLKNQNKQFYASLDAQEKAQRAQIESNERIAQLQADTTNRNADNRLNFDREQFEFNKSKVYAEIAQIKQNTKVLETVAQGNNLDNIRKEFENKRLPTLAKLADISAWQNIEYVAMKLAHENAEHMNQQERESLELEFLRATMDSGIGLQNIQNELQTYLSTQELNTYKDPILGNFIGALVFSMEKLAPKFALFK